MRAPTRPRHLLLGAGFMPVPRSAHRHTSLQQGGPLSRDLPDSTQLAAAGQLAGRSSPLRWGRSTPPLAPGRDSNSHGPKVHRGLSPARLPLRHLGRWSSRRDSNSQRAPSKGAASTVGQRDDVVLRAGFEPASSPWRGEILPLDDGRAHVEPPVGLEPTTSGLRNRRCFQLSYGGNGRPPGN